MPLSDAKVRALKPRAKLFKAYDERGLFVAVTPAGSRLWRLRCRVNCREQTLSFGEYPAVTLAQAREKRDDALERIARGDDPREPARLAAEAGTFERVALEWLAEIASRKEWDDETATAVRRRLELWAFPKLGAMRIDAVEARHIRPVLLAVDRSGKGDTAHRVRSAVCRIIRFAAGKGYVPEERDPTAALRDTLTPVRSERFASVKTPTEIGELLVAIRGYMGTPVVRAALNLAPLVFVRPTELRHAKWAHIDLDAAEWRIPAEGMKSERDHVVPLSRQAAAILKELRPFTARNPDGWVFPSHHGRGRPMSENTVNAALRRLGYDGSEQTGHGFRSMASTVLNELRDETDPAYNWNEDAIERQLAHVEGGVRGVYNHADHLAMRRRMMQVWADHLDSLAAAVAED